MYFFEGFFFFCFEHHKVDEAGDVSTGGRVTLAWHLPLSVTQTQSGTDPKKRNPLKLDIVRGI